MKKYFEAANFDGLKDRIIILKDGKIAEMGTHDELIKTGGYYSEVYELQK